MSLDSVRDYCINAYEQIKAKAFEWFSGTDLNTIKALQIVSFFGIGFFIGFFLKKYFKEVVLIIAGLIITLIILEYFTLIDINWIALKSVAKVQGTETVEDLFSILIIYIKEQFLLIISFLIGLVIGSRLG